MPRSSSARVHRLSWLLVAGSAALVHGAAATGCGGRVLVDVEGEGGAGGDTFTTSTTTTSTTTTSTSTTTPCGCLTDADCGLGMLCDDCTCAPAGCLPGTFDCDGLPENGCEVTGGPCTCAPGETATCYEGPAGTEGVGACEAGVKTCVAGVAWSACEGQVLPSTEVCDGLDNDCEGHGDDWDTDGDGWTICDNDCCETAACAPSPEHVNPGAQELPGNILDDDCNPSTADGVPYPTCGEPALMTPTSSLDLVKAMDLCVFTSEDPPLTDRTWGVISAVLSLADGSTTAPPTDVQTGVLANYGLIEVPKYGTTMAALSSGTARDEGDPGFIHPQNGATPEQVGNYKVGTAAPVPSELVGPDGNVSSPCFSCVQEGCGTAFDSVALKIRLRVPTNTDHMELGASFFSAEYPESVCSMFNDFFATLLDSKHPDTPANKNIAFAGPGQYLSVNTAPFTVCVYPGCSAGPASLQGTGMGGWDGVLADGGGTGWVKVGAAVVPGETIELRLMIWDAIDGNVDSLVLLDRFRFTLGGSAPPSP